MDEIIEDLKSKKTGEKYHDFVIDDAIFHLEKAKECITEGMKSPYNWYEENMIIAKTFKDAFPQLYLLQQFHTPVRQDESAEN